MQKQIVISQISGDSNLRVSFKGPNFIGIQMESKIETNLLLKIRALTLSWR